jgi:hypothetical protein
LDLLQDNERLKLKSLVQYDKSQLSGHFRWWLKEKGFPSADGSGKGAKSTLGVTTSLKPRGGED